MKAIKAVIVSLVTIKGFAGAAPTYGEEPAPKAPIKHWEWHEKGHCCTWWKQPDICYVTTKEQCIGQTQSRS